MTPIRTALLALSALALSFGAAVAQGHDHGGHQDGGNHGGRGGYSGGVAPRDRRGGGEVSQGYAARGYAPAPYERPSFARGHEDIGDVEGQVFAPGPQSFRRGQYMPRDYWVGGITDPHSRHLRTPPPGYRWVGVGRDAYLMQRSTGLILDSVPGAW